MPYYTGLARVARSTGRPVEEVEGWEKRGHGPMSEVKSIICHHTAGPNNGKNYPSMSTVKNGSKALPGPLAQFGIGRDGTIYVIAAGLSYHAGKVGSTAHGNASAIGIEAENNGLGEPWGDEIMESYVKLVAALIKEFKLPLSAVLGHKEVAVPRGRKIDPSFSMDTFRNAVKRGYWKGNKAPAKPKPETTKPQASKPKPSTGKGWPAQPLKVTSKHTAESHEAWVELLAAVGYKDRDLTKNFQRWLQDLGYYPKNYLIDGSFGEWTVKALQSFLKSKKLYHGLIDGKRQGMTVEAEIKYLNLPANRGV